MIKRKQWVLLPADLVMDQPNLQLSPLDVVSQRDRRPRTISDYSYYLVNTDTSKLAPQTAMQFGKALNRILQYIQSHFDNTEDNGQTQSNEGDNSEDESYKKIR